MRNSVRVKGCVRCAHAYAGGMKKYRIVERCPKFSACTAMHMEGKFYRFERGRMPRYCIRSGGVPADCVFTLRPRAKRGVKP